MLRELFQDTAQNPDEQSHNELPHLVEGDIQPGDSLEDGVEEVQGEAGRARGLVHQWHHHVIPYEVTDNVVDMYQGPIILRLTGQVYRSATDPGSK